MDSHVNLVGYLYLAYAGLLLLGALLTSIVLTGSGALADDPAAMGILASISGVVWVILLVIAVPYLLAGWGLLQRREWARVLALVLGALALFSVPIGTALGVYALWALTRPEAQATFR